MKQSGSEAGAIAAIRFAVGNLERVMVHTVLSTSVQNRPVVMTCLMNILEKWSREVPRCKPEDDPGGGGDPQGPDCQGGWIPVNGYCIPPPDPPGN